MTFVAVAIAVIAGQVAAGAPVVEAAPNVYGETGVVRTTSAEAPGNLSFDVAASGFFFTANQYLVGGKADSDVLTGGTLALSAAFLDVIELSLATRGAGNANTARPPSQFSVGDLYPSLKLGFPLGPVAIGADLRGLLPTRVDGAGFDLGNAGVTAEGLITLDLHRAMDIPVRVNLDGGYVTQFGKYADPAKVKKLEQNPNFYPGIDGQLLSLAADAWFYDQAVGGLSVEVPLPYATPFVEAWYQTAVGVPKGRGVLGKDYDPAHDAHLTITPGARITVGAGFTLDLGVDIGLLGTGDGKDAKSLVDGTPPNPAFLARAGITYTFDPFHGGGSPQTVGGGTSATGQLKGCVSDDAGRPVVAAIVTGPALGGARIATDEAGCFVTPPIATGDVELSVEKPGYEKLALTASIDKGKTSETSGKLKGGGSGSPTVVAGAGTARILGYVTNKEDETLDAELELWDSTGVKPAGKAIAGAFDLQAAAGSVDVVAKADGYLAQGASLVLDGGGRGRVSIVLKKASKAKKAILEKDKIAVTSKVPFEFKKPRLQSTAEYVLDDVVDVLCRNPGLKVRVDVYAEPLANADESQKLADERAAAVVDYLTSHGVWPGRLSSHGIPLPANEGDKSRRVELIVVP